MSRFSRLFLLNILFSIASNSLQRQNIPKLLTDGNNGKKSIDYVSDDQCMPQPGQEQIHSFGLQFHLPFMNLCENEGLLICYPGQLDGQNRVGGMIFNRQFVVNNVENNEVAERCGKKQMEFCGGKPSHQFDEGPCAIPWHGILLRTIDGGQSIEMKLSICPNSYSFGQVEHFWIRFGQWDSLFTSIGLPKIGKRRVFKHDRELLKEFQKNVGKGATMAKYAGVWLIGLDVLPGEDAEQIHFFVYRDCDCLLNVWFTDPSTYLGPIENEEITIGHDECPAKQLDLYINLDEIKEDQKIVVEMLVAENAVELVVELVDKEKEETFWSMKMDTKNIVFSNNNSIPVGLPQGYQIHMEIIFHRYFHDIAYGDGNAIIQRIWPEKWWNATLVDQMGFLHFKGDAQMLKKEQIVQGNAAEMFYKGAPIVQHFENIVHVSQMQLKIKGKSLDDAQGWAINLLHDAQEWHKCIGLTMLQIRANFTEKSLSATSYAYQQWAEGNATTKGVANPFSPGAVFECDILVTAMKSKKNNNEIYTNFTITLHVENKAGLIKYYYVDLPIWLLNWIQIVGDMQLLSEIEVVHKATFDEDKNKVYALDHLFHVGDKLCISGNAGNKFGINLQHDSSQFTEQIGDTPLQIRVNFDAGPESQFQTFVHIGGDNGGKWQNLSSGSNMIANQGDQFSLAIIAGGEAGNGIFHIRANNNEKYERKVNATIPIWTAKYVQMLGQIEQMKMDPQCTEFSPLPRWIVQINEMDSLGVGKSITIQGTIKMPKNGKKNGSLFSVNFFNQALDWDPKYGQTILQANFSVSGKTMTLNSYLNGEWLINNQKEHKYSLDPPLKDGQEFSMKISITDENYEIYLDNLGEANPCKYPHKELAVPPWAIDYVVVKGAEDGDGQVLSLTSDIQIE